MKNDLILVMALESESQGIFEKNNVPVVYTGVGKVNAAYALTKALKDYKPNLILNLGTAGSRNYKRGSLIASNKFVQRDMDVSPLGFKFGETPFCNSPIVIEHKKLDLSNIEYGVCGSGDSFDVSHNPNIEYDLTDMEAFALAKICWFENLDFLSIKYITDGADDNAAIDWQASLKDASEKLFEIYSALRKAF